MLNKIILSCFVKLNYISICSWIVVFTKNVILYRNCIFFSLTIIILKHLWIYSQGYSVARTTRFLKRVCGDREIIIIRLKKSLMSILYSQFSSCDFVTPSKRITNKNITRPRAQFQFSRGSTKSSSESIFPEYFRSPIFTASLFLISVPPDPLQRRPFTGPRDVYRPCSYVWDFGLLIVCTTRYVICLRCSAAQSVCSESWCPHRFSPSRTREFI